MRHWYHPPTIASRASLVPSAHHSFACVTGTIRPPKLRVRHWYHPPTIASRAARAAAAAAAASAPRRAAAAPSAPPLPVAAASASACVGSAVRQTGQVCRRAIQGCRHASWKGCRQGMSAAESPRAKASQQMAHEAAAVAEEGEVVSSADVTAAEVPELPTAVDIKHPKSSAPPPLLLLPESAALSSLRRRLPSSCGAHHRQRRGHARG